MDLERIKKLIAKWAKEKEFVKSVYIFGSRATGRSYKTGLPPKPESDLDIAMTIDAIKGDSDSFTSWTSESSRWEQELAAILGFKDPNLLDLERYDVDTPHIHAYVQYGSEQIYERRH